MADVEALVVMSFGGPESMADVVPFLQRVTAGRGIPDDRLAQVAEQYRAFQGHSPLNSWNRALVDRLRAQAPDSWLGERVWLANRNSSPFAADTFADLHAAGVRRAAVFVTSAFSSYSGCRQYRENLAAGLAEAGVELQLRVLPRFHSHPLLRDLWADRVVAAAPGPDTTVVFVTHSLPTSQAVGVVPGVSGYRAEFESLAGAIATVAGECGVSCHWATAYQSRSGPPSQPWLEPDISEVVRQAAAAGRGRVVVAPIGFLADNLEIRWDLDVTAAAVAGEVGVAFERLDPPQRDPRFTDLVWDLLATAPALPCDRACCPNPRGARPAVGDRKTSGGSS